MTGVYNYVCIRSVLRMYILLSSTGLHLHMINIDSIHIYDTHSLRTLCKI